jgi:hypothetical protein
MSTVRLHSIWREYRNERYRNVSRLFLLHHECKNNACAPFTFPTCTIVSSVCSQWLSCERGKYGRNHVQAASWYACMGASSVRRWVKHFKDGNMNIAYQLRCGQLRTAATECRKSDKTEEWQSEKLQHSLEWDTVQSRRWRRFWDVGKLFSRSVPRLLTGNKNGWELLFHPSYSPDLAPSDYHFFGPL